MIFVEDMRVTARRELRSPREREAVKRGAKGTVVCVIENLVYVLFDGCTFERAVSPCDLLPITFDEMATLEPEFWGMLWQREGGAA